VHFLLCGAGIERGNPAIAHRVDELGLNGRCHLLGPRRDMPAIHASLDVATSSSISEAFPLVLGEAMSCCVPCVATNVGDSALILGDTGRIVPARDPAALAAAWAALLSLKPQARHDLGQAARRRVVELFDLSAVTRRYETVYDQVISGKQAQQKQTPDAPVQSKSPKNRAIDRRAVAVASA
jgi:glycosyltransferase involved in cell wall biosynthesis